MVEANGTHIAIGFLAARWWWSEFEMPHTAALPLHHTGAHLLVLVQYSCPRRLQDNSCTASPFQQLRLWRHKRTRRRDCCDNLTGTAIEHCSTMATATGRETRSSVRKRASDTDRGTKKPRIEGKTDYTRWRLKDDDSRHTWHYLEDDEEMKKWPQSTAEKYYLNMPLVRGGAPSPRRADSS